VKDVPPLPPQEAERRPGRDNPTAEEGAGAAHHLQQLGPHGRRATIFFSPEMYAEVEVAPDRRRKMRQDGVSQERERQEET
jgi:hypothetical protein